MIKIGTAAVASLFLSGAAAFAQENQQSATPSFRQFETTTRYYSGKEWPSMEHETERSNVFSCKEITFVPDPSTASGFRQTNCFVPQLFGGFLIAAPPGVEPGNWTSLRPE